MNVLVRRREFITLLGGTAIAWPVAARAQEPGRIYRLGGVHASPRDAPYHVALFGELRRLGFIEGQKRGRAADLKIGAKVFTAAAQKPRDGSLTAPNIAGGRDTDPPQ